MEVLFRNKFVRAEKSLVGMSDNSPIYAYLFQCTTCANAIELRAGASSSDFRVSYGATAIEEPSEIEEEPTTPEPSDASSAPPSRPSAPTSREKPRNDESEHRSDPELEKIQARITRRHGDSVTTNRLLRSAHRVDRKAEQALVAEAKARGFAIPLLPVSQKDERHAQRVFRSKSSGGTKPPTKLIKTIQDLHHERQSGSIFGSKAPVDPQKQKLMEAFNAKRKSSSAPHR